MKRLFLIVIFLTSFLMNVSHSQEMNVGTNFLSLGIGPSSNYHSYRSSGSPALKIALDHGLKEVGPGTLTIGGSIGFFTTSYNNRWWADGRYWDYTWRWTYLVATFRLGWYYNFGELDIPDLNAYGGLGLGFRYITFSDTYGGPKDGYYPYSGSNLDFHLALYAGANYFLTKKISVFLEFGYDISPVTAGVTFKLK